MLLQMLSAFMQIFACVFVVKDSFYCILWWKNMTDKLIVLKKKLVNKD